MHAPAQTMHLVEQVQNDRDPFIVHAEIVPQIADELRTREIHVGKCDLGLPLRWNDPPCGDPALQRFMFDPSPNNKFLNRDHSNLQPATRLVALSRLPAAGEFLDLWIEWL